VVIRQTHTALSVGLMAVGFFLGALVLPVFAGPIDLPPGQGQLHVSIQDGHMSLNAEKVPLVAVLQAIADQAGIRIETDHSAAGLQETVSLILKDVSLEEGLKRLAGSLAFVYTYHPDRDIYTLTRAGLFSDTASSTVKQLVISGQTGPAPGEPDNTAESVQTGLPVKNRPRPSYIEGELLVRFKENVPAQKIDALHASFGSVVLSRVPALRTERVQLKAGLTAEQALALYRASTLVDMVGRHALRYLNLTPNDPNFGSQWGHSASRTPDAWAFTTGGAGVVVAVIDTGVRYLHPDLAGNIWTNPGEIPGNGLDDDANGYVDDIRGWDFAGSSRADPNDADADPMDGDSGHHGTHVAGIIGARGNNGTGVAGVAWNVQIMPLKVQANDSDSLASIDIITAFLYALENGARVVNCSFGGDGYDPLEYLAINTLRNAGVLVVCAAGNGDDDNNPLNTDVSPHYPSGYNLDNIIAVAAGTQVDALASFSNYGPASVDLMAPGVSVLSTYSTNTYAYKSGTSMATPFVAGVAGLLLARKPGWFYPELKAAILNTVEKTATLSGRVLSGGKLNAQFALCSAGTVTGDVTCDNAVGLPDRVAAMQIVAGTGPETCEACLSAGIDINGDLKVGLEEAAFAIRREAGL